MIGTYLTDNFFVRQISKHSQLWLRLAIIIGVLVASLLLAYKGLPTRVVIAIILLPFAVVAVLVLLRWPPLGLIGLVLAGMLITTEIFYSIGLTAIMVAGLTAFWIFYAITKRQPFLTVPNTIIFPLAALIITTILSFFVGQLPWYPTQPAPLDAQIGGVLIFIIVASAFLLSAQQINEIFWLKWLTYAFIVVGSLFVVRALVPGLRNVTQFVFPPGMSGSVFWIWLVAMSFGQALYNKKLHLGWRLVFAAITVITMLNLLYQSRDWSSGWLPATIALFVTLWAGSPRLAYRLGIIGLVIFAFGAQSFLERFIFIGDNAYSQLTRLEAWRIVGEIVKVNPILGLGPANYSFYTPLFPILGWFVKFNSHNNYVDIIAQIGILGLICLLWFYGVIGRLLWRLKSRVPSDGFVSAYIYAAFGGFVATVFTGMLGDWVIPYVYNITIRGLRASILAWIFLGGVVAIDLMIKRGRIES